MALYQRFSPARSEGERTGNGNTHKHLTTASTPLKQQKATGKHQLLRASELPSWYAHNAYLLTGYRPITGSVRLCIDSLRTLHNETVNIYSHLLPALLALASNGLLHMYFTARYPNSTVLALGHRLAVHVYLSTSVLCFGLSAAYHTLLCHSEEYAGLWGRMDYVAILLQTIGSFVSGIYVSFNCEEGLRRVYWTMTLVLGFLSTVIVVSPKFQSSRWRMLRLATFVATGMSGLIPIVHAASIYPYAEWNPRLGLGYYLLEGLMLIMGTLFYATHFPESWMPEKFDIWGASHQLFHIFVVISAGIHIWTLFSVLDWVYTNPRCMV
ncbi:hypothetical protein AJ78_03980 [Emergomyces pasteurianus Ep9510]|uniref:Hemolysin-III channel protein Izh2 n=1 Tax=Emergomyces pasteurianus Ep9510 TaxID=1447872 RepID=A0A1J9PH98_9EURO|nr:hypothetical protein AJ78_03980 [Emergomyces pasteurianus Ep9510]